jgi:hypothetical protein
LDSTSTVLNIFRIDIQKSRLLAWGNTIGILDDNHRNEMLEDQSIAELLKRCLENIERLLTDSEELRRSYGVINSDLPRDRAIDFLSSNSIKLFRITYSRFRTRHPLRDYRPTLASRAKWAIYEQAKFEQLINNLKDLIDGLYQIIHVDRETQDSIIVADIGLIEDLSQLKLIDAASEDSSYPVYSNAAKSVIAASEMGSVDHRLAEGRIRDAEVLHHSGPATRSQAGGLPSSTNLGT